MEYIIYILSISFALVAGYHVGLKRGLELKRISLTPPISKREKAHVLGTMPAHPDHALARIISPLALAQEKDLDTAFSEKI